MKRVAACVSGVERDATDDLCGDATGGRPCDERVAATGGCYRELPRVAGGFARICAEHVEEGGGGRSGSIAVLG